MKKKIFIPIILIYFIIFGILVYKKVTEKKEDIIVTDIEYEDIEENVDFSTYTKQIIDLNTIGDSSNVKVADDTITITSGGIYEFSGHFNGTMIIDAKGEYINIILNGATIESKEGPALYIKKSELVLLTIENENTLSDTSNYSSTNKEFNGTIYSTADIVVEGTGTLKIDANYEDGIVSKDTLKINNGNIIIDSVGDGIRGKDSVIIKDGNITIDSDCDGIKSTNTEDSSLGYILIEKGTFSITSTQDGIQAETNLVIKDGIFNIKTGGGSINVSSNNNWGYWGNNNYTDSDTESAKGIKAGSSISILSGTFNVDSSDDSIHSNDSIQIDGGTLNLSSGDDGIHADSNLTVNSGTLTIQKSYEGLEGTEIYVKGGTISITASDDGINAAGGSDTTTDAPMGPRRDMFSGSTGTLYITGGNLYVDAAGDGLDSNGNTEMSGGTVIVEGPTSAGNGALDYDGTFNITGGTLLAIGSTGMDESPSSSSIQYTLHFNISRKSADSNIVLKDSEGNEIINHTPTKQYSSIIISSNSIIKGNTYTLTIDNTEIASITATDVITKYGSSSNGIMSSQGGHPGGMRR